MRPESEAQPYGLAELAHALRIPEKCSECSRRIDARALGVPSKRKPVRPLCTIDGKSPTGVEMTGVPHARASSATVGRPSLDEGTTRASAAERNTGISMRLRGPRKRMEVPVFLSAADALVVPSS